MSDEIKSQLNKIKEMQGNINPSREWVSRNREKLMSQISNTVEEKAPTFFDQASEMAYLFFPGKVMQTAARPVLMFFIIASVLVGGWITSVGATANCLPGDTCWNVKLAAEKTHELIVKVTGSKESNTQLQMEFAKRRAEEVNKVVEKKSDDSKKNATVAIQYLKDSIAAANASIKEVGQSSPEKVLELTKDLNLKTDEIVQNLKEAELKVAGVDAGLKVEMAETKKIVNDAGISAIEVVLQKQADGTLVGKQEEVKTLVQDKIDSILKETETSKIVADGVKVTTDEKVVASPSSTPLLNTSTTILLPDIKVTSTSGVVSTTLQVVSSTDALKDVVVQVVNNASSTAQVVKDNLTQAKDMIANNQLTEAVEKLKMSNNVSTELQKVVTDVKIVVDQVVSSTPVVVSSTPTVTK